jgi:PDZ domain-containing protein
LTTSGEILQEPNRPSRRVRIPVIVGAVVVLLVAGAIGLLKVGADGYFVLSPGQAPLVTASPGCRAVGGGSFALPNGGPCVQLVVPADKIHTVRGAIYMVDVYQGKPSPWQYLLYKLGLLKRFGNNAVFVPNAAIIGRGTAAQISCQDTQQSVQATSAAPVAALRQLGYEVGETDLGAQVDTVLPGSPADAAGLHCNDLITAVNGHAVHTAEDVSAHLAGLEPGTTVEITVSREAGQATHTMHLTAQLGPTPALRGQPVNPNKGFLGIETETRTNYDLPFPLSAEVGSIGGPSDGLALALGFIDTLSEGHLTGGLKVAATGQIEPNGDVVEIGGAAQKAVAVRRAGATVFLVPPANLADAKSTAGNLKVYPVSTLSQALDVLKSLGGQVPPPPPTTTTTTTTSK